MEGRPDPSSSARSPGKRLLRERQVHEQHLKVGARPQGIEVGVSSHERDIPQAGGDGPAQGSERPVRPGY